VTDPRRPVTSPTPPVRSPSGPDARSGKTPPGGTPDKKADEPAPVALDADGVRAKLSGLKVSGTLRAERVTEGFNPQTTYQKWVADVRVDNQSDVPVALGSDMFLVEVPLAGDEFDGFAVFCKHGGVTSPDSYGLSRNYERHGSITNTGGGQVRWSFGSKVGENFGAVGAGRPWALKRDFPQFTWLSEEARGEVCLVLPELCVKTTGGAERFRMLAYFGRPKPGEPLAFRASRLVRIEAGALKGELAEPGADGVRRVLAANWLAEAFPKDAPPALAAAADRASSSRPRCCSLPG
jgi:hypothetical protein